MMLVETQRKTITVGIVEPQEATQYAISMLLNGQPDSEVVGIESDGEVGMRMLTEKRPRIAIVEIDLEGRSGFELAGDLAMRQRETKVIFYSGSMPDIYIEQAIRSKAAGYVLKTDSLANLLAAVQTVSKGGTFYSQEIRERISIDPVTGNTQVQFESRLTQLSDRQLEVLRNLAYGMSVKDVSRRMHISVKSVDSHKYRIMQSLGIHDRVDLARYAIREGLVCP
ncbi:MAG: response regulator transcription factor [Planctomycetota bacterium]|nr:response regulator transcription factor [Planctomycetota bacterium]